MTFQREGLGNSGAPQFLLVVTSSFLRRSGSRVSILIAGRRTLPAAVSFCVNPMHRGKGRADHSVKREISALRMAIPLLTKDKQIYKQQETEQFHKRAN